MLSSPLNLKGQPLNYTTIHLSWIAPPSIDLTGVDLDISYYEILVFHNKTDQTENFTVNATEFIYTRDTSIGSIETCQELDFSVQAVNIVGKGDKTTVGIAFHTGIGDSI